MSYVFNYDKDTSTYSMNVYESKKCVAVFRAYILNNVVEDVQAINLCGRPLALYSLTARFACAVGNFVFTGNVQPNDSSSNLFQ